MYNIPNMYLLWVDRQSRHIRKLPWGLSGGFLEEEIYGDSHLKFELSEKHTIFEKNLPHALDVY